MLTTYPLNSEAKKFCFETCIAMKSADDDDDDDVIKPPNFISRPGMYLHKLYPLEAAYVSDCTRAVSK